MSQQQGNETDIRPRVLFVVNEVAHFHEFKKLLSSQFIISRLDHLILFDRPGYEVDKLFEREISESKQAGFKWVISPHQSSQLTLTTSTSLFKRVRHERKNYEQRLKQLRRLFEEQNIETIVLGEENILMDTFVYKMAARGRRVIVYPYTIPNPLEMAGGAYRSFSSISPVGLLQKMIFNGFVRKYKDKLYLLISPQKILAQKILGYRAKNPWVLNSDTADAICVESEKMSSLYRSFGVPAHRLQITGTVNDDIIAEKLKNRDDLQEQFQINNGLAKKPIVVVGFPPNQYPLPTAEHLTYEEMIQTLARTLQPFTNHFHIVVTKHPRIKVSLELLKDLGFIVTDSPTVDMIPLADMYVASASATIRWALAAGIPVINYDMFRYYYTDYEGAKGVKTIYNEIDFKNTLEYNLNNADNFLKFKKQAQEEASFWGKLDGRSSQRLIALMTK